MCGGVVSVGDDVAVGHRIDCDEEIGIHRKTHRGPDPSGRIYLGACRELRGRQQRVQPATRGQRDGQLVVGQAHRRHPAGRARRQPWTVGQRPDHGDLQRFRRVGRHHAHHPVGFGDRRIGRHAQHRQQEPRIIEACRFAVVGGAVDVDEQGVHAGLLDRQRRRRRRTNGIRQRERPGLAAVELGYDGDELGDRRKTVNGSGQRRAQPSRRGDRVAVLEPHHDVAHRPVAHVGDGSRDGHGRVAGGGDQVRGHVLDADLQERRLARLARRGVRLRAHQHRCGQQRSHRGQPQGLDTPPKNHCSGPLPFVRPDSVRSGPGRSLCRSGWRRGWEWV